jgi:hypothetical protein
VTAAAASNRTFSTTPLQTTFVEAALSGKYSYLATGGAIRGTKTFMLLATIIILCRIYPRSRWAIVRDSMTTLRRNTLPSFEKLRETLNGWVGELHQGTWTYTCKNGSQIIVFAESAEKDPDLDRWKGLEVNGFALDEANELLYKSFLKSIERAGSWIIPPTREQAQAMEEARMRDDPNWQSYGPAQPDPLVMLSFNPADNWVRDVFYDPWEAGMLKAPYYYLPATIFDNPYAPDKYKESLKNLPKQEYNRFVLGKWGAILDPMQLISSAWLIDAQRVRHIPGKKRGALDVARFGDDDSVLAAEDGNALDELEEMHGMNTATLAARAVTFLFEKGIFPYDFTVDTVGVGGGVMDNIVVNYKMPGVRSFEAGAKALIRPLTETDIKRLLTTYENDARQSFWKFDSLWSQAWWEFRENLRTGKWHFPPDIAHTDIGRKLVRELTAPKYEIHGDRTIRVWSTEEIKDKIGWSPDRAVAVVMANFDWPPVLEQFIPPTTSQRVIRGSG